jgi:cbb3-type cytochrome oxidase subunit 3
MIFSFWGVLLAAPLLAVVYAYRARNKERHNPPVEILLPSR